MSTVRGAGSGVRGLRFRRWLPVLAVLVVPAAAATQTTLLDRSDFRSEMRKLWEDHVTWTRVYLISATAKLPDKDAAAKRLLKNQDDIGAAVKLFYGDATAVRLTALLKDHIRIATQIVDVALIPDDTMRKPLTDTWTANADSIAMLLSGVNPVNWPLDQLKTLLHSHLEHTNAELVARMQKDWAADVAEYDKVHDEILKLADKLSSGIIRQYPRKFGR